MADLPESNGLYFKINEVAKQVGVVPATIRNWERSGLINVRRTPSGYRIFDLNDIEYLKKIKQKSKDENIGINGIRLLSQDSQASAMAMRNQDRSQREQPVSPHLLSPKWKEYRLSRGYSLEDVASLVGISASYLSKIENQQANVSYELLEKLAKFYGQNILYYYKESSSPSHMVRRGTAETFQIGIEGLTLESVIAQKDSTFSAMIYTTEPGSEHTDDSCHNGEEFVYVLSGKVEFLLDNQSYMLSSGDTLCFRSTIPHRWRNTSSRVARFLWVYTPLVRL